MAKGGTKSPAQREAQIKRTKANKIRRCEKELAKNPNNVKVKEQLDKLKKQK